MRSLLLVCVFTLAGCIATGSSIVVGTVRPETKPEAVKVLLKPPANYETIGLVEALGYDSGDKQTTTDLALNELKAQAAKLGANAILLLDTANQQAYSGSYSRFTGFTMGQSNRVAMKAEAIWTP